MNMVYLRTEIVRLFRNKRVLIFSLVLPAMMLLLIGGTSVNDADGRAYVMVSMGLFGAMNAAIGSGGQIAVERGLGWNRTLRLTTLTPRAYVLGKVVLALLLAVPPLVVTFAAGAFGLHVSLHPGVWALVFVGAWLSALPFAMLGLVIGYLARPDSIQQISGLLYIGLAALGGLWVPVEVMPHVMRTIAGFTPTYWAGQVARSPLFHGHLDPKALLVLLGWTVALGLVALRRFRVDTARA
jgi:ABC-2 type transport system permease protein